MYQHEATSVIGFVRQLCQYLANGYWFYVTGSIKPSRNPHDVDQRLLTKFGVGISRQARWRRKRKGLANVHYLRHERFWILVATKGPHEFFEQHVTRNEQGLVTRRFFRDARITPILFQGYSLRVARGNYRRRERGSDRFVPPQPDDKYRVRVQIARTAYLDLCAEFLELARQSGWTSKALESLIYRVPFEPYAPIRQQLLDLVRRMNRVRRQRGIQDLLVAKNAIRLRIQAVSPFVKIDEPPSDH
ncbi:MAG: hypothetical protein KDA87_03830 [Planctomycetales bacterium]|nr:hypothetical protein [Planctomycetales bacterium]